NEAPMAVPLTLVPPTAEASASVPQSALPPVAPLGTSIDPPAFRWAAHLSSLVVILATAAYLIGFIIVNTSLFRFGMVPYDFLQSRNVSAGLLYLAATAGFTGLYISLIYLAKRKYFVGDAINGELKSAWAVFVVFWVAGPYLDWWRPPLQQM